MLEKTIAALKNRFAKKKEEDFDTSMDETAPEVKQDTVTTTDDSASKSTSIKQIITRVFAVATPLAVAGGSYFGFEASQVTEIVTEVGVIISGIVGIWFAVKK